MSLMIETNIRGQNYRLIRLNPVTGGRIALKVGTILAAAADNTDVIGTLIQSYKDQQGAGAAAVEALTSTPKLLQALAGGVAKVDADALYELAMQCVRDHVMTEKRKLGNDEAINEHFGSYPDHLFLVLAWALKENCAGFFGLGAKA